jgi:hypothetical protein
MGERLAAAASLTPLPDQDAVISYRLLRMLVGIIGFALPVVAVLGKLWLNGRGVESSISAYYYTHMRNYFVGSLCAIGVFLFSYRYAPRDNFLSNIAAVLVIFVAVFPTSPTNATDWVGKVHLVCASGFFVVLGYFAFRLFRETGPDPTPRKLLRNRIYLVCGIAIWVSVALAAITGLTFSSELVATWHPLLVLEAVAVYAFSFSWLVKGGLWLFADN